LRNENCDLWCLLSLIVSMKAIKWCLRPRNSALIAGASGASAGPQSHRSESISPLKRWNSNCEPPRACEQPRHLPPPACSLSSECLSLSLPRQWRLILSACHRTREETTDLDFVCKTMNKTGSSGETWESAGICCCCPSASEYLTLFSPCHNHGETVIVETGGAL
jgi:hypothetical protein